MTKRYVVACMLFASACSAPPPPSGHSADEPVYTSTFVSHDKEGHMVVKVEPIFSDGTLAFGATTHSGVAELQQGLQYEGSTTSACSNTNYWRMWDISGYSGNVLCFDADGVDETWDLSGFQRGCSGITCFSNWAGAVRSWQAGTPGTSTGYAYLESNNSSCGTILYGDYQYTADSCVAAATQVEELTVIMGPAP